LTGEISFLDEEDFVAAQGCIQGHPSTCCPSSNDANIKSLVEFTELVWSIKGHTGLFTSNLKNKMQKIPLMWIKMKEIL
jgi:hypothetical protein